MPVRRVNSTGRKRIAREDVQFFLRPDSDGVLAFDALLDLNTYKLPADAKVFVEAYRQTTFMRFPHGTVSEPKAPDYAVRRLTEFATADGVLFRVKVTSTDEPSGVLLAEADRIPASDDEEQPDRRVPLLPPAPEDLGQEVWRVSFNGDAGPMLLINRNVGDWKEVASSALFRSLVYPAAMGIVLSHIAREGDITLEDSSDWRSRWLKFTSSLPGVGEPPIGKNPQDEWEEWRDWIEDAVGSFARTHGMLSQYKAATAEGK
jgi:hypothetical protein